MNFDEIKSVIDFDSINELRNKNNKIISKRRRVILLINLVIFMAAMILLWPIFPIFLLIIISIIGFIFIYYILYRIFIKKYEDEYKKSFENNVIEIIFKALNYNLEFKVEHKLKSSEFNEGKIIANYNVFDPEELFEGTLEDIAVKFSEVSIATKFRYSKTIHMRGFYANFQYNFNNDLVIDVIKDESSDNSVLQKLNFKRNTLVKIDDLAFEKQYVIYSNQTELTQELISPTLIKNLNGLSSQLGSNLYFTIRKGKVHIAYDDAEDYFVIDFNKTSEELAEVFYLDTQKIYNNMLLIKHFLDNNVANVLKIS